MTLLIIVHKQVSSHLCLIHFPLVLVSVTLIHLPFLLMDIYESDGKKQMVVVVSWHFYTMHSLPMCCKSALKARLALAKALVADRIIMSSS